MADENAPEAPAPSARERRRERAGSKGMNISPGIRRTVLGYIVIVVLFGAIIGGVIATQSDGPKCPGHWHAAFQVYVEGERVPFVHDSFLNPPGGHDYHLHDDSGTLHFHPSVVRCIPLEDMMDRLAVTLTGGAMVLGSQHGGFAGTYTSNATHDLKIYYKPFDEEWRETSWTSLRGKQTPNGASLLFTYGVLDDATLEAQKQTVRVSEGYQPVDMSAFPTAPVMGISIIGLLALVGWGALSRKL